MGRCATNVCLPNNGQITHNHGDVIIWLACLCVIQLVVWVLRDGWHVSQSIRSVLFVVGAVCAYNDGHMSTVSSSCYIRVVYVHGD